MAPWGSPASGLAMLLFDEHEAEGGARITQVARDLTT